ncbi:unnamed protein product, partial [Didymodactylos carnosus]
DDSRLLLSWAPYNEVFAFVIYYQQKTSVRAKKEVGQWTRELIDSVLSLNGTYYLPYQLHATGEQFLKAYPRATEWFQLKKRLDPTNKFRNMLSEFVDTKKKNKVHISFILKILCLEM